MQVIIAFFQNIAVEWAVFFLSMLPVTELRASIPLGIAWGMDPLFCFIWAVIGNFVPIIPILLLLPYFYNKLKKSNFNNGVINNFILKSRRKGQQIEKYGLLGLIMIVAIPVPGTGVWTGCMIAFLLGVEFKKAVFAITLGEIIAGVIVTSASMGIALLSDFIYNSAVIVLILLVVTIIFWLFKKNSKL